MSATWFPWRWRLACLAGMFAVSWLGPCLIAGAAT